MHRIWPLLLLPLGRQVSPPCRAPTGPALRPLLLGPALLPWLLLAWLLLLLALVLLLLLLRGSHVK